MDSENFVKKAKEELKKLISRIDEIEKVVKALQDEVKSIKKTLSEDDEW